MFNQKIWSIFKKIADNNDLKKIITHRAPESIKKEAANILLNKSPSSEELFEIMQNVESLRNRAWEQLKLNHGEDGYCLMSVISNMEDIREEAIPILLNLAKTHKKNLRFITCILSYPKWNDAALNLILENNPEGEYLERLSEIEPIREKIFSIPKFKKYQLVKKLVSKYKFY